MTDHIFVYDWRHISGPLALTTIVLVLATSIAFAA